MSDHISKNSQAKAGHTDTNDIKLKSVNGATELILENTKTAMANTAGSDKVPDTDREMDLTFYDADGNVETADPNSDISMEDDTTMQSIEQDDDASSSIHELVSADTSVTTASDGATDFDCDSMQSIQQDDDVSAPIDDLLSSHDDMTNDNSGLNENDNPDEGSAAESDYEASIASLFPKLFDRNARRHSVSLAKDSEKCVIVVEGGPYYYEEDGANYEYDKYAFRKKRYRLKNKAQCSEKPPSTHPKGGKGVRLEDGRVIAFDAKNQRCDDQAFDGDSEMP